MLIRDETLTWGGMKHWFRLMQDGMGVHGTLAIIKDNGTQVIPVVFPECITVDVILEAWEKQRNNWLDLYTPVRLGNLFAVTRVIDLGDCRILWHVLHINDCPQDACVVIKKPMAPAAAK